ncbi:MAG TPA: 2-hydroxymuconate tautomerase [Conexibacter sp.]|jgi:4-oxalocrotonate tautomerase
MPLIQVSMVRGRAPEKVQAFIEALTDAAVETIGAPRESVRVLINEIPPQHWAVGGVPKSAAAQARTLTDGSTR